MSDKSVSTSASTASESSFEEDHSTNTETASDTASDTASSETNNTDETETTTESSSNDPNKTPEELCLEFKDKGNQALLDNQPSLAISHYTTALTHNPSHAITLSNRAQAYIKIENYGLAILDATSAIDSDPLYPKSYYRRGTAHLALQKYKKAKLDFKKVCQLRPKDRDARAKFAIADKLVKEALFAKAIQSEAKVPLSQKLDPATIPVLVGSGYDGPHPSKDNVLLGDGESEKEEGLFHFGNLPLEFVMAAIERFKDQKLIHKRYVARLLISSKKYFESISSLMRIPIPTEFDEKAPWMQSSTYKGSTKPHITVCGDTHGQYYDVLNIFQENGYPSSTNPYLFNGDYVDRGSFSVEVILTFLLFKAYDPTCIYLTRGNHETKNMNKIYGFEGEVKAKYDDQIMELFLEVFGHLPLAAVIGDKIFVTHGGIPTTPTTLDQIDAIPRGCEPPESGLMSDLLWSDPQPFNGKSPSKRGVGFSFGPDITSSFLEQNDLSLLIRSHEVKEEGYLVEHGGKTITVFSAPNYCDSMGNKGAMIHLDEDLDPKFIQYVAVPHPEIRPMAYASGMSGLFM